MSTVATTSTPTREPISSSKPATPRTARPWRQLLPLGILVALVLAVSLAEPAFLRTNSLTVVANQAIPILLLGLGQMFVVLVGGIDLSSAALASLTTVLVATWLPGMGGAALVLTLVALTVVGLITGALVAWGQVPSFVISLGALGFWGAVSLVVSGSTTIYVSQGYGSISWLTNMGIAGVSSAIILSVALVAVIWAVMRYTPRGNVFHVVGLNERAALMAGVRARWVKTAAFGLSGLFAGLAGIVLTAQQQSGAPQLGDALLLPAIAAAVVGGCAITGGIGGPWRVLVGALVVTVLRVGGAVAGIDPNYQQIIYGAVVILAVALTIDRTRLSIIK
ncbi:ribose transport system permease protein [Klenkia soli]|uniref:Ribose transport system permease protein n=1 Tax=Klenkia soli TaxID=1052260 RepID=A0A1H0G4G6_9ACTN|nr:ABC transporter permease [Klenkia soli]SDO01762.1 ribose transport system permease protein [Klenkia soli]